MLVMHCKHNHYKGTWTKDNRLLQPNLLPQQLLQICQRLRHHRRHYQQHNQHHQLLPWALGIPTLSTSMIPTLEQWPPNCTTRQSHNALLEEKFDGEADNLAIFLASICNQARCFNWHQLITMPIDDGMTRNLLTHYRQVSIENTRAHAATYINTPTRDVQDNDMFYYFLSDSLTNEFHMTVLLYADIYTVTNIPVASLLLKQVIILTQVDNPASTMHIREMLIESKCKLLLLKGNITEFNQWVHKQMG